MANYWLAVGDKDSWKIAFKEGNIWGLQPSHRKLWQKLAADDIILFYATKPVAGVIGYGFIRTKSEQNKPLWPREIEKNQVLWPLRFKFDVEYCLPPEKWETERITHDNLRYKAISGFANLEPGPAQQVISKFKEVTSKFKEVPTQEQQVEVPLHRELQEKVLEIGKLQQYITEKEYPCAIVKLDVVWRRREGSVPTHVFEIQIGGDVYRALAKLKHAYDLWNSRLFLIVPQENCGKAIELLQRIFPEINKQIKIIKPEKIEELYRRKRSYLDLEKELGIIA